LPAGIKVIITQNIGRCYTLDVKMKLIAQFCGMGPTIAADAQGKVMQLPSIANAKVKLEWEPAWNQSMISEAGRMQQGMVLAEECVPGSDCVRQGWTLVSKRANQESFLHLRTTLP
jgi:metal-sulfur cluster biosynthetic enzyme